jgi:hypothetical protein
MRPAQSWAMTTLLFCRRCGLMTGGAPKWRTIKTVFSLPESDALEGGIFQSNWYVGLATLHLDICFFMKSIKRQL